MNNFPNPSIVVRFCSIPYEVDTEAGTVVACRNESVGQIQFETEDGPVELEICAWHRDKYGLDNAN